MPIFAPSVSSRQCRSPFSSWRRQVSLGLILLAPLYLLPSAPSVGQDTPKAAEAAAADGGNAPQPVETDMHEFMEYAFEPAYGRLKAALAAAPADNAGWKIAKADSLVLAEGANLLWLRAPAEQAAEWKSISAAVRDAGAQLYQAAKKKDYAASRQHYQVMLQNCNRCHDAFADGEHQLKP